MTVMIVQLRCLQTEASSLHLLNRWKLESPPTGPLPAQFGFRTTGIIDIHTKDGAALNGGEISFYGGSHETINPSFEFGGAQGRFQYFGVGLLLPDRL
jgi:hypothetical protein